MENVITRPLLPPRAGYVEVIDENGNHVYKPTPETEAKIQQEAELRALQTELTAMYDEMAAAYKEGVDQA